MNKSEKIVALAQALSKAQAEMPAVKMNATNPFLKNKYADLGAVIEASRKPLAAHGLAIVQTPISDGDKIGVTTLLTHESGEWLEDTIMLDVGDEKGKSRAQVAGSIITYLRRYSLSAFLNLYADEDTDGHAQVKPAQSAPVTPPTLEESQAMKTSDGKTYGELSREQLEKIAHTEAAPAVKRSAARVIIAQLIKEGK